MDNKKVTHLFVHAEEYVDNEEFFVSVSKNTKVYIIQDRAPNIKLPEGIMCIYAPFYLILAVSAINNESMVLNLNERRDDGISFTAPKAKILVVDDNAINLKVATGLMQPLKHQSDAEGGNSELHIPDSIEPSVLDNRKGMINFNSRI